jgi:hypothetical protein
VALVPGIVVGYLPPDGLAWGDLSKAFRAAAGRGDGNSLNRAGMKVLAAEAKRLRELGTMRASSRPRLRLITGGKIDPAERGPYFKGGRDDTV